MSPAHRARRSLPALLTGLALVLALAACGTEDGSELGTGAPSSTPSATGSPSPEEGDDASETPAAPPSGPAVTTGEDLLLDADQVPGLNETTTWTEETGGSDGAQEPLGICQKASLSDIGATEVVSRRFTTEGGTATQVVAAVADTRSTEQMRSVLGTWRQQCADTIPADESEVGDLLPVDVTHGTAEAYVVHFSDASVSDGHIWQSVAINTHDTWVSLVVIESTGMDYNYGTGQTPAELAAAAVAARIG